MLEEVGQGGCAFGCVFDGSELGLRGCVDKSVSFGGGKQVVRALFHWSFSLRKASAKTAPGDNENAFAF
jgi:hypothetical protein